LFVLFGVCVNCARVFVDPYTVSAIEINPNPVISNQADGSGTIAHSDFIQSFNPSWLPKISGSRSPLPGLVVRAQNCSDGYSNCPGMKSPSVIAYTPCISGCDDPASPSNRYSYPVFGPLTTDNIIIQPQGVNEQYGTEDPRIALVNDTYYLFYTAYGGNTTTQTIYLSLATSTSPTEASSWIRYGPVFPQIPDSKSGALLYRPNESIHYLFWGDSDIHIATTPDLLNYTTQSVFFSPRAGCFDSKLVESGPLPMLLSDGNYLFIYNSANESTAYHVGYVILDGKDPTRIIQRADCNTPLFSPTLPWEVGTKPYYCNVPNVIFLEAVHPTSVPNQFRVYFGGADAVVGTAVVKVVAT